jgi:GlpG protein
MLGMPGSPPVPRSRRSAAAGTGGLRAAESFIAWISHFHKLGDDKADQAAVWRDPAQAKTELWSARVRPGQAVENLIEGFHSGVDQPGHPAGKIINRAGIGDVRFQFTPDNLGVLSGGMRLIGYLANELNARTFADYLLVEGMESHVEPDPEKGWALWVNDEDKIEAASGLLSAFQKNPGDPQYSARAKIAGALRTERRKDAASFEKRVRTRQSLFQSLSGYGFGLLTYVLILLCLAVCVKSNFGQNQEAIAGLFISNPMAQSGEDFRKLALPEVRHGQVWRLVTPMLIHFGLIHIFCNMMWLRDLGSMIEGRESSGRLALLVLVLAAASNLGQYYVSGPSFGGMSGVVYGLLGYIWIRGRCDPASGLFLHSSTVTMMLIWFFLCLAHVFGPIANTTHAVGLVLGMAWGYLASPRVRS